MEYIVDSNVIIDIFTNDPNWFEWSYKTLAFYSDSNILAINPIVYSEISLRFQTIEELEDTLSPQCFHMKHLSLEACFLAGKCFQLYKKNKGIKNSILPDFYIGAHAAVTGMGLITRDVSRYKTYFPKLKIIHP